MGIIIDLNIFSLTLLILYFRIVSNLILTTVYSNSSNKIGPENIIKKMQHGHRFSEEIDFLKLIACLAQVLAYLCKFNAFAIAKNRCLNFVGRLCSSNCKILLGAGI